MDGACPAIQPEHVTPRILGSLHTQLQLIQTLLCCLMTRRQHQSNGEHPSQGTAESKLSDDELRVGSRVTTMPNGLEDDRSSIIDNAEARSQPSHIRMAWG